SQPLVVAFMLEQLEPKEGDKILDIGSGSGWTTALLAHIVSQKGNPKSEIRNPKQIQNGKVIAMEVIPELKEFGEKNVAKYNFIKKGLVEFILADGSKGYKKEAPFDKILVSATAEKFFPDWKEQLKIGG
ncbi:MAG: class I SAM-dependent methyltransferase, partial [Thermodesulfovibrionales bacterium]|nr:class I SAM-dependent methyltransferase [Thermodesulfovibrionales bacterium]